MPWSNFSPSDKFLGQATVQHLKSNWGINGASIKVAQEINKKILWRPSLHFDWTGKQIIAIETSETNPYPVALKIAAPSIQHVQVPITMYAVCPEDLYLLKSNQKHVKELREHGCGLFTVDAEGNVTEQFGGHPLIQHIPNEEFKSEIKKIPPTIKLSASSAFIAYKNNPGNGVAEISQTIESAILNVKKIVIKKGWASNTSMGNTVSEHLNCMMGLNDLKTARAGLGGLIRFVAEYRNTAAHPPKNAKQAFQKYYECQHAFRDGVKCLKTFCEQMKNLKINVKV